MDKWSSPLPLLLQFALCSMCEAEGGPPQGDVRRRRTEESLDDARTDCQALSNDFSAWLGKACSMLLIPDSSSACTTLYACVMLHAMDLLCLMLEW